MRYALQAAAVVAALVAGATITHAQSAAIGTWQMTTSSPVSETKSTLVIREDNGVLKAFAKGERGERPYDKIEVAGDKITLVMTINYEGSPMVITYTGTIDKGKMGGDADFGGLATGSWSAIAQ